MLLARLNMSTSYALTHTLEGFGCEAALSELSPGLKGLLWTQRLAERRKLSPNLRSKLRVLASAWPQREVELLVQTAGPGLAQGQTFLLGWKDNPR